MRWGSRATSPAGCASWRTGRSWNRHRPPGCSASRRANAPGASSGASPTPGACEAAGDTRVSESSSEAAEVIEVTPEDLEAAKAAEASESSEDIGAEESGEDSGGPFSG